jgi:radical SAM protein with 4Fe4S-binding SPASM domain
MDFFHAEFGCKTLHCQIAAAHPTSPEYLPAETRLSLMGDAIEYSLINLALGVDKTVSTAVRLMNAVTYRTPIGNYCPAGRSEITVNADGELYACFMLMQSRAYSFGTVNSDRRVSKSSRLRVIQPGTDEGRHLIEGLIQDSDKSANVACQRCWAQPLCFGCQGEDFERLGGRFTRSEVPGVSAFCDEKRALVDRFLQSIVRAHVLATSRPSGCNGLKRDEWSENGR